MLFELLLAQIDQPYLRPTQSKINLWVQFDFKYGSSKSSFFWTKNSLILDESKNYKAKKQKVCLKLKKMFAQFEKVQLSFALLEFKLSNKFPVDT